MNDDPIYIPLEREESFGRNLLLVLGIHVAVLATVWIVDKLWKKPVEQIVWLDGAGELGAPAAPPQGGPAETSGERSVAPPPPEPEKLRPKIEEAPKPPVPPPEAPSDFAEKKPTPVPTPKPTPKPESKPKPEPTPRPKTPTPEPKKEVKTTPKAAPKATPKAPAAVAKVATPKQAPKSAVVATPKPAVTREGASGTGAADTTANNGTGAATVAGDDRQALRGKYGDIVGGRFKAAGAGRKPVSVEGNNREFPTLIRFKIARDGSVVSVNVVTASGNPLVDDWIRATIPDFQRVPPPPTGLLRDGVYEDSMEVIYEY